MAEFYFPHQASGEYVLEKPKDPAGADITGGSGTMTWYRGSAPITGQSWPQAVTWDSGTSSYRAPILDTCVTTLGERLIGKINITAGNGKKYYDLLHAQVRTPSSSAP